MLLKIPRVVKRWKHPSFFTLPKGEYCDNGVGRRFLSHANAPFRDEAFAAFGIAEAVCEPTFGNFAGNHYLNGAFTLAHRDSAPAGYVHTRCNWMLKKPPKGGNPVLDDVVVPVDEGDLWICFASLEQHESIPIAGGERLIQSFGALVPVSALSHILEGQP